MNSLNKLCNFTTSKRLEKRGINAYFEESGYGCSSYFDHKGNITQERTPYPCVSYERILAWLMYIDIIPVVQRFTEDGLFHGCLYFPSSDKNEQGELIYRKRGSFYTGEDHDALQIAMIDKAIMAAPTTRRYH